MKRGRTSSTAAWVAFARALGDAGATHVRDFSDPVAHRFLPRHLALAARVVQKTRAFGGGAIAWRLSGGFIDMLPLRTRKIDEALASALESGVRQLVILGAGLDARAWRLDALADCVVFEVDHPDTQAFKRSRVESVAPRSSGIRFVAVDFERDDLVTSLQGAGHQASERSVFIWEGVTTYLPHDVQRATLEAVKRLCADGSTLVATYVEPDVGPATFRIARRVVSLAGEPFRGEILRAEMMSMLGATGFNVVEDTGAAEWAHRYSRTPSKGWLHRPRIVVARS